MAWESELAAALRAAHAADTVILEAYSRLDPRADAPANVTTQTDHDSQEAIIRSLAETFPRDGFRAEEATPTVQKVATVGPRMWIIDPIDGTRGFVTKKGEFSVMIALVVDGVPVVGVVSEPAQSRVTFATRGGGCHQTVAGVTRRVSTTATNSLNASTLVQSHTKPGRPPSREVACVGPAKVLETYSAGVKLARVADGTADLYVCDYAVMNDWDLAAGHALVVEAGGVVTNLAGEPRTYGLESPAQHGGILASNRPLHSLAVQALRS